MLHVNDDNRDELYRKAAEDYFLAADNPGWQAFINKMNTHPLPVKEESVLPKDKRRKKIRQLFQKLSHYRVVIRQALRFEWWPGNDKKKVDANAWPGVRYLRSPYFFPQLI